MTAEGIRKPEVDVTVPATVLNESPELAEMLDRAQKKYRFQMGTRINNPQ